MSVARLAVRLAAVNAIRGRTWAGDRVKDSQIAPMHEAAPDEALPFVAVYTDDAELEGAAHDTASNAGKLALVFEIGVTTKMKPRRDGQPGEWAIPTTDAGMEMTIDGIARQIALALDDPGNAWAALFKTLCPSIIARRAQRGASAQDGMRFAARQMTYEVETLREPVAGRAPSGVWARFLTLAAADPLLADSVPVLETLITGGATNWPEIRRVIANYGYTTEEAAALHVAGPPSAGPVITSIAVSGAAVPQPIMPLDPAAMPVMENT